jgi:hypothetical protein
MSDWQRCDGCGEWLTEQNLTGDTLLCDDCFRTEAGQILLWYDGKIRQWTGDGEKAALLAIALPERAAALHQLRLLRRPSGQADLQRNCRFGGSTWGTE